ncbi:MAG: sporulation protein YtfJ [Clostridia bacterium]|nr:sporulation protein YtfJ [Clostridia bacterium]
MSDTSKLSDVIRTSLENVRSMVDANTVVGTPITTANGTTVIPVSKVFFGFASGGIDYVGKKATVPADKQNFGGGGGSGLTVSPVAFLIISPEGSVEVVNVETPTPQDAVSQVISLIEKSPDLIAKLKKLFAKKNEDEDGEEK